MTIKEEIEKVKSVRWKTSFCQTGESCWCRVIEPEEHLIDKDGADVYVVGSGSLYKEYAEHIVKIHNQSLVNRV